MSSERSLKQWIGEFGVIVFGVAAALAAENWREAQVERSLADDYLVRLEAELADGAPTLRAHKSRVDSAVLTIDVLLGRSAPDSPLSRADSVSLILNAANYAFNPAGVVLDLTYREMLATGSLNHVHDPIIRDEISRYFRAAYRLADVLAEKRDDGVRTWGRKISVATGGGTGTLRNDPSLADEETEERLLSILRAADSADALRETRGGLIGIQRFLDSVVVRTDRLLELLN